MTSQSAYQHTQRAPLCLILYALAVVEFTLVWVLRNEPALQWLFLAVGVLVLILAASFHHLTVADQGDRLLISFGPIPLLRRTVRYDEITSAELGRTTLLDGWGIHLSWRGGWVWNIWGRDCVVLRLNKGTLRIGSDDAENLVRFLHARIFNAEHAEPRQQRLPSVG